MGASDLTPRELRILRMMADDLSDREIAADLGVGRRTVSNHVSVILLKLGARNRTEAVVQVEYSPRRSFFGSASSSCQMAPMLEPRRFAMRRRAALGLLSAAALSLAGWMIVSRLVESGESPLARYQRILDEDAAKPGFTGEIRDFLVFSQLEIARSGEVPEEARTYDCEGTLVPLSDSLRREELWSDVFEQGGGGWSCLGQGVVLISNGPRHGEEPPPGDGSSLARGYIWSLPVPVILDAPRDRLELVTVEGHPGLLERPVEGFPYAYASLTVIERYPEGDKPGILVTVHFAPSAEAAIKHAEEVMP